MGTGARSEAISLTAAMGSFGAAFSNRPTVMRCNGSACERRMRSAITLDITTSTRAVQLELQYPAGSRHFQEPEGDLRCRPRYGFRYVAADRKGIIAEGTADINHLRGVELCHY